MLVSARQMVDFSGEWVLNREASTLSPGADAMQSAVWRITHREPTFGITARFETAGDPIEFAFELQNDGREWDGDAMIVTMAPGGGMTITFRYELSADGRVLRAHEQLRGTDHDQDNVWVFDRR